MNHVDWWLVVPTIALAIFTAGLFGYTAVLARATAQLAREANENSRRQLRAYVAVGHPKFGEKFPTTVTISATNGGQTPAYRFSMHLNRYWLPPGQQIPKDFTYSDYHDKNDSARSVAVITAGGMETFTFPISLEQLAQVQKGELLLFFYGHADYEDIFKIKRRTLFCYQYQGGPHGEGGIVHRLSLYHDHNDAT
jgi:hypothetical protein